MPITLGSNIASLRGHTGLNKVTTELRSVYERLSSGQRINRASDDAAGLAVSESLKADTRIFTQALRNIDDGISHLSIAETAVQSLTDILIRQRELATQASNGTLGNTQRLSLDAEAKALTNEYNRILASTTFAGNRVFDENGSNLVIQHGSGTLNTTNINSRSLLGLGTLAPEAVEITSFDAPDWSSSWEDVAGDTASPFYITLSTPTETYNFVFLPHANYIVPPTLPAGQTIIVAGAQGDNSIITGNNFVNAANATGDFFAELLQATVTVSNLTAGTATDATTGAFGNLTILQQGTASSADGASIYHSGVSLQTQSSARTALNTIKTIQDQILKGSGNIGSIQSRLGTTSSILHALKINYETARSRIIDADIADESSKLVRNRILQQAASSVLGQANLQPELALSLLN